jgi:hypothetical protein
MELRAPPPHLLTRKRRRRQAMKRYEGKTKVEGGFYFNTASWELVTVSGKEGMLPGAKGSYVKLPTIAVLAGAPLFSGAYVLFLPFIGFALFFREMARKTKEASERITLTTAAPPRISPRAR